MSGLRQVESSLQMELIRRIASSQRGLGSTARDRAQILNVIERLEAVQHMPVVTGSPAAPPTETPTKVAGDEGPGAERSAEVKMAPESGVPVGASREDVSGEWHLEYMSNGQLEGWDFAASSETDKVQRVSCSGRRDAVKGAEQLSCSLACSQAEVHQDVKANGVATSTAAEM